MGVTYLRPARLTGSHHPRFPQGINFGLIQTYLLPFQVYNGLIQTCLLPFDGGV
jgi:hypothetical protein